MFEVETYGKYDQYEADLWIKVFMLHLKQEYSSSACTNYANDAVESFREFFDDNNEESQDENS